MQVIGTIVAVVSDVVGSVIRTIKGILEFLTGVFTGDWTKAWKGIKDIFGGIWDGIVGILKGAVNGIISAVNWMIRGVVAGVNSVIDALNRINMSIPSWVPFGLGGQSFGFNIAHLTAPQIPLLAQGAVIPPNREFLAVLGDQSSGTNIEAPLETIKQALAEVMAQQGSGDIVLKFTGDLAQLARVLQPVIEKESNRRGYRLAKGVV